MKPTAQYAKTPQAATGILALLAGLLRGRGTGAPAIGLAAALLTLSLTAASASAETAHTFAGSFGGASTTPADPYPLGAPTAVAVDNSTGPSAGDLYVTDPAHFRVEKFDAAGNLILMFGKDVNQSTGGNVCTVASTDVCKTGVQGTGAGEFDVPAFVAVDPSSGPSAGDVYVADTGSNVVQKFTPAGALITTWGDHTPSPDGELEGKNAREGSFAAIDGIAVGGSGDLWVHAKADRLNGYEQSGAPLTGEEPEPNSTGADGLALDPQEDLYLPEGPEDFQQGVQELNPAGQQVRILAQDSDATAIAIDPSHGDVYLDTPLGIEHLEPCSLGCGFVELFGSPELVGGRGLAAQGADGAVFAADETEGVVDRFAVALEAETEAATNVTASTATVNGMVDPEGTLVTECAVEYGTEEDNYTHSQPCAEGPGAGSTAVSVHGDLTGLQPGTVYYARVLAGNEHGVAARGRQISFTTPVQAVAESFTVTDLTGKGAVLNANVNPNGLKVEGCEFEYGTEAAHETAVPCSKTPEQIGEGSAPVPVTAVLTGLEPNVEYHWRLTTTDADGTYTSPDQTFRYAEEPATLPDNRRYEMVTPDHKNASLVGAIFLHGTPTELAEDGVATADTFQCFPGATACTGTRHAEGDPYEFQHTASGWVTEQLAPPDTSFPENSAVDINAESGLGLFLMPSLPSHGEKGPEDFYLRRATGAFEQLGPLGPGNAESADLGEDREVTESPSHTMHMVYEITPSVPSWPFDETLPEGFSGSTGSTVYEYEGIGNSQPRLVAVLGGAGSTELVSRCGNILGTDGHLSYGAGHNALSNDGETVYFTSYACPAVDNYNRSIPANEIYARYEHARTQEISTPVAATCTSHLCQSAPVGDAMFQGASSDGSRVFFTSAKQLTDDASEDANPADTPFSDNGGCTGTTEGLSGCNLYESECPERCKEPSERHLIDISAGEPGHRGARVEGVMQISPDGSHVYFVSKSVLTGHRNGEGQLPVEGQANLYAYQRAAGAAEGHLAFVATLSPEDAQEWAEGVSSANVTPEGRFLVFTSHRALTRDDTRAEGPAQVYRYDDTTGELVRISVGEDGYNDNGNTGSGNATIGSGLVELNRIHPGRSDPTMSNDGGYVFFTSPIALTAHALNDYKATRQAGFSQNLYEYHEGHVSLIVAGGTTENPGLKTASVELIGSDGTGANVLFSTNDQLVPQDTNTERDFYDAHICSTTFYTERGIEPQPCPAESQISTPCSEESCQLAGEPPAAAAPPTSDSFSGPGNLVAPLIAPKPTVKTLTRAQKLTNALKICKKDKKQSKRKACEASARKKDGPTKKKSKAKKSSNDGRTSR